MSKNPFITNPLKDKTQKLIGRAKELSDALYYSDSSSMFFVLGDKGVGKTFLARKIIEEQKKNYTIQYVDAREFPKNKDIQVILKPKKVILIIDNAQHLTRRNIERVKYYFDQNYVLSVMFLGSKYELNDSLKSRIGNRLIFLEPLNQPYELYASRTEPVMSRQEVSALYEKSDNLKEFVKELAIIHSHSPHLTYMEEEKGAALDYCHDCNSTLININDEWRCQKCDVFCTLCGEIVKKEDMECPRCLAIFE